MHAARSRSTRPIRPTRRRRWSSTRRASTPGRSSATSTSPGAEFQVVGDLTIRGVTKEVTLDATYEGRGRDPWGGERVSFSADTKIDRREFGLVWNAALETGGVLVSNDIKIHIEVQAVRA